MAAYRESVGTRPNPLAALHGLRTEFDRTATGKGHFTDFLPTVEVGTDYHVGTEVVASYRDVDVPAVLTALGIGDRHRIGTGHGIVGHGNIDLAVVRLESVGTRPTPSDIVAATCILGTKTEACARTDSQRSGF